ncbi:MAG TPA: diacylglycerol kinase family protein [Alphaproteobacteria bacterium]|jgi:diacylglycerol kinase family enzyme|nr:diacylglycerol kinase family protein [Alphaproteobacteria bacterium]
MNAGRRVLVVDNPIAGRRRRRPGSFRRTIDALAAGGCITTVLPTGGPDQAEALVREARDDPGLEADVVVASGGDGTVNEVLCGLLDGASTRDGVFQGPAFATFPFGTVNVLALEIGLEPKPADMAGMVANGRIIEATVGRVEGRRFLLCVGAGLDSAAVKYLKPWLKSAIGRGAYFVALLIALIRDGGTIFEVEIDGQRHQASTVIVSNCSRFAGPHVVAPEARLDDGTLHVLLGLRSGRWNLIRYGIAYARGRIPFLDDVLVQPARQLRILEPKGYAVQVDGDLRGHLPVEVVAEEARLRLLVPQ